MNTYTMKLSRLVLCARIGLITIAALACNFGGLFASPLPASSPTPAPTLTLSPAPGTPLPTAVATTGDSTFEDSAFGIFAAFSANEHGYFKSRMGFTDEQYWAWAEGHMKNLGAHWTRSNLQLIWDKIEPTLGGGYNWDNEMLTDSIVKRIYAPGNEIQWLAVFHEGGAASRDPNRPPLRNALDYPEEYQAFVRAAVERYDGDGLEDAAPGVRVKYWQVGNEIPGWQNSGRTVQDYVQFVRLIRQAAQAADPEAKIVLIAGEGHRMNSFLVEVIESLADERAFDVIDLHHWGTAQQWQMPSVPEYRQLLDAEGLTDVEIWSCEHGTWQGQPGELFGAPPQSEEDQARSLVKRYVYNLNNGLDKLFWNNLMEWHRFSGREGSIFNSMGLITDGQGQGEDPARFDTERVAYWTYKMLAARIDTPVSTPLGTMDGVYREGEIYAYAYQRKDNGKMLYILWSETGPQDVTFNVGTPTVRLTNLITDRYGNILEQREIPASGGQVTLTVGADPVLVEE